MTLTDNYGLFTITIGDPTNANDDLYNLAWDLYPHFLNVQVLDKGTWFNSGTSQLLSVPYALHAETATNALSADYNDLTNKPTGNNIVDMLYWDGTNWITTPGG